MALWDASWHYARVIIAGTQTVHALGCALCAGWIALDAQLSTLLILGTFSEVANRYGTMWFIRPGRTLPLWPVIRPLASLSHIMTRLRWPNQALAGAFSVALACALVHTAALAPAVLSMWLLCLLDGWRLLYTHYWLAGLTALLFGDAPRNILVMLGGLYFWSGELDLSLSTCRCCICRGREIVLPVVLYIRSTPGVCPGAACGI